MAIILPDIRTPSFRAGYSARNRTLRVVPDCGRSAELQGPAGQGSRVHREAFTLQVGYCVHRYRVLYTYYVQASVYTCTGFCVFMYMGGRSIEGRKKRDKKEIELVAFSFFL